MKMIVTTNRLMGLSGLERNGYFPSSSHISPIPQNPIFSIGITRKNLNPGRIFTVRAQVDSGKSLEKQLQFQPTFDEYLKAMESVRTGVDQKTIENKEEDSELGSERGRKGRGRRKLGFRERGSVNFEEEDGNKLEKSLPRIDGEFNKMNGARANHRFGEVEKKKLESKFGKSIASNRDLQEGGSGPKGKFTGMQKKEPSPNVMQVRTQVNKVEPRTDFDRKKFYRSDIGRKLGELKSNHRGVARSDIEPKVSESDRVPGSNIRKLIHVNKAERKMDDLEDSSKMEKERYYRSQGNHRPDNNAYVREKLNPSRTRAHTILGGQTHTDTENTNAVRSQMFTRGSKLLKENVGENDLAMERAAFKSFQVFTDVRGEPRVTRMEMEKRIENLAKWLNGTDIDLPEWMFSKMMHSAKIRFSDHSILRIIQILGKLGNWRRVLQVIEWLQSRERFKSYKSRFIYTAALDALGKAKRPVEALNVFYGMQKELSSYPDLASYHCIAVTLGQAGYTKELFDIIDSMRSPPQKTFKTGVHEKWDPRMEPDIVVYNAVLNACAQRKQWEGAFWVLQQLKQQGLHPSSTTYGLVMEVMFACGMYNLVHEFFRKMEKSSIPNSLNYRVLVNTLWKEGKTDEAVFAVQDMERRGIVGSASLYYDLARCLCSAGRCHEALMQIDKIVKVANKPLVVTYTGLIQACLDTGNIQDGSYIFKQMHKFCSPNLVTYNIMLKAYIEHKMFEDAKDLFQKMLDDSCGLSSRDDYKTCVVPDNYTFNTMLNACAVEQKWDEFAYIYQQMIHRGFNFNTKRHLQMVLEACRAGKGELLEITWKHLNRAGRVPPPPMVKERFCMKLEEEDYATAIFCITNHPTDELHAAFSEKGWSDLFKANINRFKKDALARLTQELRTLIAGSAQPHPTVNNLLNSCRHFVRTHMDPHEVNLKSQNS